MDNDGASRTAVSAAAARAAHLVVDAPPFISEDTLAGLLLGDQAGEILGFHRAHGSRPVLAGTRLTVTSRSRYAKGRLLEATNRGVDRATGRGRRDLCRLWYAGRGGERRAVAQLLQAFRHGAAARAARLPSHRAARPAGLDRHDPLGSLRRPPTSPPRHARASSDPSALNIRLWRATA